MGGSQKDTRQMPAGWNFYRSGKVMRGSAQLCGLLCFRPYILQRFANAVSYLVVFSLTSILQGMAMGYSASTTTMMQKRFKISSRTMGIVFCAKDISFVGSSLILAYYGGRGHRPLWLTFGTVSIALSAYIFASLHFLYGPGQQALALTEEYFDIAVINASTPAQKETRLLCEENRTLSDQCEENMLDTGEFSFVPLVFIFLSEFFMGIGTILIVVLGETYLDDHTKKENSPIMLGIVKSVKHLGPALGNLYSSFFLVLYVDPTLTPIINTKDPRWLGAWWLGWLVLGFMQLISGTLMAFFPKKIPARRESLVPREGRRSGQFHEYLQEQEALTTNTENNVGITVKKQSERDSFITSFVRLLKNKVLIYSTFGSVFNAMVQSGTMMFSFKNLEIQFQISAAYVSVIGGTVPAVGLVIGLFGTGILIGKLKLSTRVVLGLNVIVGLLEGLVYVINMFLTCDSTGNQAAETRYYQTNFMSDCNSACGCNDVKYQPVCYLDKHITFYSPCHIGCRDKYLDANVTKMFFTNCSCIPDVTSNTSLATADGTFVTDSLSYLDGDTPVIANGPCPLNCPNLYIYVAITFIVFLIVGLGRLGNTLLSFRCVDPKDKSFAQGLHFLMLTVFGIIPGPIIFGSIIDHACLVWESGCGSRGHCTLYDKDKFRWYFNITAAVLTTIGTFVDFRVFHLAKDINLYKEKNQDDESEDQLKLKKRQSGEHST